MKIEYKSTALTAAGYRSVYVIAEAKKLSEKRCEVVRVLTINDEVPRCRMSRTGARRQEFNGLKLAELEEGKKKNISQLYKLIEDEI